MGKINILTSHGKKKKIFFFLIISDNNTTKKKKNDTKTGSLLKIQASDRPKQQTAKSQVFLQFIITDST